MANVIHGVGKPRFAITEDALYSDTVASATSTTIALTTGTDLAGLELNYGLTGRLVYSFNSADDETYGVISGYSESPDILQVPSWSKGNPDTGKVLTIKNIRIDLPYCEQLKEGFTPDLIQKKMFSGDIRTRRRGFYYKATLSYGNYMSKTVLSSLRHLYRTNTGIITFYPRLDNTKVAYRVEIDGSEFLFYQIQKFQGHKGIEFNLTGTQRLSEANIFDLIGTTGYGVGYGTNYGTNF